jgi:CheY-like chemotaxis protein
MSHELRTPLNAILGFAQLLRHDRTLGPEHQTHAEVIYRSGEQLLALISDLLELSRQEPGTAANTTSFDLHLLLEDLGDMLYLRAERRGLRLVIAREPGLPRLVRADAPLLRQLLLLLLGNAIRRHHPLPAPVALDLRVACVRDPHDPGAGKLRCMLAAPDLPDFALDFAPEDDDRQMASELATQLEGRLEVRADGMHLALPVGLISGSQELGDGNERQVTGLAPGQPSFRILVAEDRWQSRQLLVHMLARVGFEVREAATGEEAVALWERWQPHLIWMDMRMPGVSGLEAARRIKASPGGSSTVIIALTASAYDEDPETARAAGCDDFVRKPIRMPEIFAKLGEHLGAQFSYEDPLTPEHAAPALDPHALAGLRPQWLADLHRASVQADLDEILGLIDHIRGEAPELAAALTGLARRFTYDRIIELTRTALAGGQP